MPNPFEMFKQGIDAQMRKMKADQIKKAEEKARQKLEEERQKQLRISEEKAKIELEKARLLEMSSQELIVEMIFALRGFTQRVSELEKNYEELEQKIEDLASDVSDLESKLMELDMQNNSEQ